MEIPERQKVQILSELAEANRLLTSIENLTLQDTPFCCVVTSAAWGKARPR